jgi:flagellar motility protein MotE (MotC chaperone)
MFGRLLGGFGAALAYLCIATVLAEAICLGFLATQGKLNEELVLRVVAAANGIDRPSATDKGDGDADRDERQVSLDDLARARALTSRDLELREQALANNVAVVKTEYDKLIDEKDRYERIKTAFRAQLDELHEGVLANNRETARIILESVKPKQAKDQVLRMVKDGEMNDVVSLLSLMPTTKRAKIIGEFKTDDEAAILAEILKLIREGGPEAKLIEDAKQELQQPTDGANGRP